MLKIKWSAATNKLSHRSIKDYSLDEYFAGYCTILSKWEMANFPRKKHFNPQAYEPLAKDKAESSIKRKISPYFPVFPPFPPFPSDISMSSSPVFLPQQPMLTKRGNVSVWCRPSSNRNVTSHGEQASWSKKIISPDTKDTVCLTFRAHSIGQLRHVTVKTLPSGEESEGLFLATKPCCFGYDDAKT